MIYTQEELEGMSDDKLNEIATKLKYSGYVAYYYPCANWGDCGALIDELHSLEQVSYEVMEDKSICFYCALDTTSFYLDKFHVKGQGHKRAITIVYILIKQGNQNDN